jgi:hypothetical protein
VVASEIPVASCGGLRNRLYRLVCSDRCKDGVYLGKIYENDSISELKRLSYPQEDTSRSRFMNWKLSRSEETSFLQ